MLDAGQVGHPGMPTQTMLLGEAVALSQELRDVSPRNASHKGESMKDTHHSKAHSSKTAAIPSSVDMNLLPPRDPPHERHDVPLTWSDGVERRDVSLEGLHNEALHIDHQPHLDLNIMGRHHLPLHGPAAHRIGH
uniref:Uncharacterized protein n=1 Tax=Hemiselmis tepida TaxID=464990 RepID=A0A7S0YL60_9CRYP|mmetsp:Transcript_13893/g.35479  ORF Transcript_13893/g.35479 Transcript_13893/m.35479 type:complete len:135 (+) Transcript_13893:190-594(+)